MENFTIHTASMTQLRHNMWFQSIIQRLVRYALMYMCTLKMENTFPSENSVLQGATRQSMTLCNIIFIEDIPLCISIQ